MRTTVDLPTAVHRRAKQLAQRRGESLSAVVAELTARGLAQLDDPPELTVHTSAGFPVISIGRTMTTEEASELADEL